MFEEKQPQSNQQNDLSTDMNSSRAVDGIISDQSLPPVDLPISGQRPVKPKPGRDLPGTEDIFSDMERSQSPIAPPGFGTIPDLREVVEAPVKPSAKSSEIIAGPLEPLAELPDDLEDESGGGRKFFRIGVLAAAVIIIVGGWFAYSYFFKADVALDLPDVNLNSLNPAEINKQFEDDIINLNLNNNVNQTATEEIAPAGETENNLDSDRDGLTDDEEGQYRTDPFEADSDGDELYDREEVLSYQTDPLNPDTDGDGYLDGDEVKNGYDPLGPGRLLDLNFE